MWPAVRRAGRQGRAAALAAGRGAAGAALTWTPERLPSTSRGLSWTAGSLSQMARRRTQHLLALDPFTLAALRPHVELLDRERAEFGPDYHDYGVLFCWEDGRRPHPDTITRRSKKLAAAAGLPEIDLHDVRHSYATLGRDAKIDWKALSQRIGHADVAFTMKQYVQTDLEADRQVANTLADLIIGGSLASFEIAGTAREAG